MAEGENKKVEGENKKVVEMSIWFIILLVVVIVASAFMITKNREVKELNDTVADLQKTVDRLNRNEKRKTDAIVEIVDQIQKGNITNRDLLSKLNGLTGSGDVAGLPEAEVSGEEIENGLEEIPDEVPDEGTEVAE